MHDFLPNPANHIGMDDLGQAIHAEIQLQMWSGHSGTSGKGVEVNDEWITVPDPPSIPGDAGSHLTLPSSCYQYFTYPTIPLPLSVLREGENTFRFTAGPQHCFSNNWGQWGAYEATFRLL